MPTLVLTPTGGTALDLIGTSGTGVRLARETSVESLLPVPVYDEEYAESADSEGGFRVRSRPQNPGGAGRVRICGATPTELAGYERTWQQTIEQTRRNGGTFVYTPDGGVAVTYDIESIRITAMPQDVALRSRGMSFSDFEHTCRPYGRLADVTVFTSLALPGLPMTAFPVGDRDFATAVLFDVPSLYWRLGAAGATDQSGNTRNGTAGGGITIGGVAAPGGLSATETDAATDFDGTDDRITSSYSPFSDTAERTYMGFARRDTSTTNDALMAGGGGVTAPSLTLLSGGTDVRFRIQDNSALATLSTTWTGAWPGNSQWVHWALAVDLANDVAELFINGISQGIKTGLTGVHATPGNVQLGAVGSAFSDPFDGQQDEFQVYEVRLGPERVFANYVAGKTRFAIPGSAPARAKLTLIETAGQNRDHVEIGVKDRLASQFRQTNLIAAADFSNSGFGGTRTTRSGAYDPVGAGNTVVRCSLLTRPQAFCLIAGPHIGRFRVKLRLYLAGAGSIFVRLVWRIPGGAFTKNDWVRFPSRRGSNYAEWREADLGLLNIPDATVGGQRWEGWIELYSETNGDIADLNMAQLFPASRYLKIRSPVAPSDPVLMVMHDEFDQVAGALTGKTLPSSGVWAGAGSATDFQVNATLHVAERTATADAAWVGRYVVGPTTMTDCILRGDAYFSAVAPIGVFGPSPAALARYTDVNNWLMFGLDTSDGSVFVTKRIGGTFQNIGWYKIGITGRIPGVWYTILFYVGADGSWRFDAGLRDSGLVTYLTGQDDDLATGGALASGKVGVYDENQSAVASTRRYDNVVAFTGEAPQHVINANKTLVIDHEKALREPASGPYWARPPLAEGKYLELSPGEMSQLAIKARRNDVDVAQDSNVAYKISATLEVTPRVALLG